MKILHNLMRSLSKREKFFFRKLNAEATDTSFWKLYEYLLEHPGASVSEVKEHFPNTALATNTHVEINYLYHHLLRAMHIYRLNKENTLHTFLKKLDYIEILIEKGLYHQANFFVRHLKKKGYKKESLEFLLLLLRFEERVRDLSNIIPTEEEILRQETERRKILSEISIRSELKELKSDLIHFQFRLNGTPIKVAKEKKAFQKRIDAIKSEPFTVIGKYLFYSVNIMNAQFQGKYPMAKQRSQQELDLMNNHKAFFTDFEMLKSLNNYLFQMIYLKDYQDFDTKYKMMLAFESSKNIPKHIYLYFKVYLRLAMEIKMNDIHVLKEIVSPLFEEIKNNFEKLNSIQRDEVFQFFILSCFMTNQYEEARKILIFWGQFQNGKKITLMIKINKLITFFGLEEKQLLSYEIENFKALYQRSASENKIYPILLSLFKIMLSNAPLKKKHIEKVILEINAIKKKHNNSLFYNAFDYVKWLECYKGVLA